LADLSPQERERYLWQLSVDGFGEAAQARLKAAAVLVTRCGGVGGNVAQQLAAAGVGKLVLAHAGTLKLPDLNRQTLMASDWVGRPRIECAAHRLRELNPHVEITAVAENVNEHNVERLVGEVDLVVDCAPLFAERFLLNAQAVRQHKPMVECAMYELEAHVTVIVPGQTPCLRCLYPEDPVYWRRQFPVFGAVAGTIGCLGAMEAIKVLTGLGRPLLGTLLTCDLREMSFHRTHLKRNPLCTVCESANPAAETTG
jgi:molybdopterin/thiamine biosynthesis adenylyltransferase